jgi:hypothetical protein
MNRQNKFALILITAIVITAALLSIILSLERNPEIQTETIMQGRIVTLSHYYSDTTQNGAITGKWFTTGVLFSDGRSFRIEGWPELALRIEYKFILGPADEFGKHKALKIQEMDYASH